jgi:hypothetical protein
MEDDFGSNLLTRNLGINREDVNIRREEKGAQIGMA